MTDIISDTYFESMQGLTVSFQLAHVEFST